MRGLYWLGWVMFIWASADFAAGWLRGVDIWKEVFGLDGQGPIHFSPTIVSCFAIVLIGAGARA